MTFKFSSLALLAAVTTAATAQTTPPSTTATKPAVHHTAATTATSTTALSPKIPKVVGIPKILYSLKYIDISVGTGPLAQSRKYYTVHYTGYLTDGTKFDSSVDRGTPITFPYGAHQVIPGWDTGFEGMHIGGKRRLFVPYQLAYGETGRPPTIPAKAELIFDVELIGQSDTPPTPPQRPAPPTAPGDSAKPSTDAPAKPATANPTTDPTKPTTQAAPATAPTETKPATPDAQPKTDSHPDTH
jgi:peptidylprolyl isomerase